MNLSELLVNIKSDSIKNLICAAEIKTQEDAEKRIAEGYTTCRTADKLKEMYPHIPAEKIWYNNGFDLTFYYDKEKLILFPITMYGTSEICFFGNTEYEILNKANKIKTDIEQGNYYLPFLVLRDKMRMEMLDCIIREDRTENIYDLFKQFYVTSDYGCSELSFDSIRKLNQSKNNEQKSQTQEELKDFPRKITVYRGEGDKSSDWKEAVSWTTDINMANFFASRMTGRKGTIHIAEVNKENIIEFFPAENECIVLSENLNYQGCIEIYGLDFLDRELQLVSKKYKQYRDNVLEDVDFQIDDAEHGRLHSMRVLLHCLFLADLKGLPEEETDMLCTAAVFHDTMRSNNGEDDIHGQASADYYLDCVDREYVKYSETVERLIKYHCLPDEVGRCEMPESEHHLLDIFKDADALDRVRFGIRALDMNQLRTEEAKSMSMVADIFLKHIKEPEQELGQDMTM